MRIHLRDGLPYVKAHLIYRGQRLTFENVLLDTGSAGVIFSADSVLPVGLMYEPADPVYRIRGVGGAEFVFSKCVDCLAVGALEINDFHIEVGAMDYGFAIDGIIGMDFLVRVGAVIDLAKFEMHRAMEQSDLGAGD